MPATTILSQLAGLFVRPPSLPAIEPEPGARRPSGKLARGVPNAKVRCIVVRVDEETFQRIGRVARAADATVTEAIRQIIKRGLDGSHNGGA